MPEILYPHNFEEIIIDDSLVLQALQLEQADEVFLLTDANREYLGQWLPWVDQTVTPEDSSRFIGATKQKRETGSELGFGIFFDNKVVGHISLMHVTDDKDPEIGYWVAQDYSGKGITSKVAEAVTNFAFQTLGLEKVIIRADTENIGSNRVAEKLGYILERQDAEGMKILNIWAKHRN